MTSGVPAWRIAAIAVRRASNKTTTGDQHHLRGYAERLRSYDCGCWLSVTLR